MYLSIDRSIYLYLSLSRSVSVLSLALTLSPSLHLSLSLSLSLSPSLPSSLPSYTFSQLLSALRRKGESPETLLTTRMNNSLSPEDIQNTAPSSIPRIVRHLVDEGSRGFRCKSVLLEPGGSRPCPGLMRVDCRGPKN